MSNNSSQRTPAKVVNKIPSILEEKGYVVRDLLYGARLAPGTAYALANPKQSQKTISNDVLARIIEFLEVGIEDIFEYIPAEKASP